MLGLLPASTYFINKFACQESSTGLVHFLIIATPYAMRASTVVELKI